ncbi:MAG: type II toxin-antitoxin system HicB family antitoxin [Vulcanococcus sp.]
MHTPGLDLETWMLYCIRLLETDEALLNIREAIQLWLEVEAEEAGVKTVETLELAV